MTDYIYYYDKITHERKLLGEIQCGSDGFNMSFVIDGTKDSTRLIVKGFSEEEVEPFTIIKHENTNTWWIIKHDKVERYENDTGFFYVHNLQLNGAVDILNHRDFVGCGFTDKRYTIKEFALRIIKLSNFEFATTFESNLLVDENLLVEYIKAFENYSPLSALNEFFNGYNCDCKLRFNETKVGDKYYITSATLYLVSKTGNTTNVLQESVFNNVQGIRTMDSNSFGTTTISNAEKVISSISKTYPASGTIALSSNEYNINNANAILRLPSPVYKVNWLRLFPNIQLYVSVYGGTGVLGHETTISTIGELEEYIESIAKKMETDYSDPTSANVVRASYTNYIDKLMLMFRTTFYNILGYDRETNTFKSNNRLPYLYKTKDSVFPAGSELAFFGFVGVSTKQLKDSLPNKNHSFYYEQGKDFVGGFDVLDNQNNASWDGYSTWLNTNFLDGDKSFSYSYEYNGTTYGITFSVRETTTNTTPNYWVVYNKISVSNTRWQVNYVPMSDFKIKYNNRANGLDTQMYNQNGKMNDGVALSKLIDSYNEQIETDTLTRYGTYYDFATMPKCGDVVNVNSKYYVINNVSATFNQNEESYFIQGEFSLSKQIAVKSLMTNPNTNIRDYEIPQANNVRRVQMYRDFYNIDHTTDTTSTINWLMPLNKLLNVSNFAQENKEHTAIIKLTYNDLVENSYSWYYQLGTTKYLLDKAIYEIIDFKDNNIIGYDSENVWTGFDITKIFTGMYMVVNTPVSYVDNIGEVKDIDIAFCDSEQLYDQYYNLALDNGGTLQNAAIGVHVFIPSEIYEGNGNNVVGAKNDCDFLISETNYNKDAIEVPVFEYSCQVDNSDDFTFGDMIFNFDDYDYFVYAIYRVSPNSINENNWSTLTDNDLVFNNVSHTISYGYANAKIEFASSTELDITQYSSVSIAEETKGITFTGKTNISGTNDLVVIRKKIGALQDYTNSESASVYGKASDGNKTYTINMQSGETISDVDIELMDGYKSDTGYSTCSYDSDRVAYVIGGQTYDDTIASGTLTITLQVDAQEINGSVDVSGRDIDGTKTITVDLQGLTLSDVNITIDPVSESEVGAYVNIVNVNYSTGVISYYCGATIANRRIYATITYKLTRSATTRTIVETIQGNKTETQYYLVSLALGETITSATISNITLQNNNLEGAYANKISYADGVLTYEVGCDDIAQNVGAIITWKVSGQRRKVERDLMFVVKNMENANIDDGVLKLKINYHKLS